MFKLRKKTMQLSWSSMTASVLCVAATATAAIDDTGWESILNDSAGNQVVSNLTGSGLRGIMSVYGENARTLGIQLEIEPYSKLIDKTGMGDGVIPERLGPIMAAATHGDGRVMVIGFKSYLTSLTTAKLEQDAGFLNRSLQWLSDQHDISNLNVLVQNESYSKLGVDTYREKIKVDGNKVWVTQTNSHVRVGSVTVLNTANLTAQLAAADVYIGTMSPFTTDQLDEVRNFVSAGNSVLTGDSPPSSSALDYGRDHYSYPVEDMPVLADFNQKINAFLRPVGIGIAYGMPDRSGAVAFTTDIPIQWSKKYSGKLFDAIDDYKDVHNGNTSGDDLRKATLLGQQIFALTQTLANGDPLRTQLDAYIPTHLNTNLEDAKVKGPIQKALCMHEAVGLMRRTADNPGKSVLADSSWMFAPVPPASEMPRTDNADLVINWRRDTMQPTEFYVPPGEVVTLDFSSCPAMTTNGFSIVVNVENTYNFHSELNFPRPPLMQRVFPLDNTIEKITHPYGDIIYIKMKGAAVSDDDDLGSKFRVAKDFADQTGLDYENDTVVKVSGAVRCAYFESGKHTNEDWEEMLATRVGYKAVLHGKYAWVDLPRSYVEEVGLTDAATRMARMDYSYSLASEVGLPITMSTARITDIDIPGREPGMPTRYGRMSTADEGASLSGMPAHKVGHVVFGTTTTPYSNIGDGTEFRANRMTWYHMYKNGQTSKEYSVELSNNPNVQYKSRDSMAAMHAVSAYLLDDPNNSYATGTSEPDREDDTTGGMRLALLWMFWGQDFYGKPGVNVWGDIYRSFGEDIKTILDADSGTNPEFELHPDEGVDVHAGDMAIRAAAESGVNLMPFLELFGFSIPTNAMTNAVFNGTYEWMPFGFAYSSKAKTIAVNSSCLLDFRENATERLISAMGYNKEIIHPEFLGIIKQPSHGTLTSTSVTNQYNYQADTGFVGRDLITFRMRHPDTGNELDVDLYIQVEDIAAVEPPVTALEKYGHGVYMEEFLYSDGTVYTELLNQNPSVIPDQTYITQSGYESQRINLGSDTMSMRTRGYLTVPQDGDYVFWIESHGNFTFRMNTNSWDPSGVNYEYVDTRTEETKRIYYTDKGQPRKTASITLEAGKYYYIELTRGNRDSGGLSIGWTQDPDADNPDEIIPNEYLVPVHRPQSIKAQTDHIQVTPGKSIDIPVLDNDLDFRFADENDTSYIQVILAGLASRGTTELLPGERIIRYTPSSDYTQGTDRFQYLIRSRCFRGKAQLGTVEISMGNNNPPTAKAGSNFSVTDSDNNGFETVTLNGSNSSDSDGNIVSYVWTVNGLQVATGKTASYDASVGETTVKLTVTDNAGATDSDTVKVTVNVGPPSGNTFTFNPVDDTYALENKKTTNVGSTGDLRVKNASGKSKQSFLKFNVSGISGTIESATLKLYSQVAISDTTVSAVSDSSWSESTLNWNNKPAIGSALSTVNGITAGTWNSFDVSALVTGDGTYSVALTTTSDGAALDFDSKEAASIPVLEIVVAGGEPPAEDVLDGIVSGWDLSGVPTVNDAERGDVMEFDGTNGVNADNADDINLQASTHKSWSVWFKATDVNTRQVIYEQGGKTRGANIYLDAGEVIQGIWGMEANPEAYLGEPVSADTWHHAVLVMDGGTVRAYLDGSLINTAAGGSLAAHSGGIGIGYVNGKTKFADGGATLSRKYSGLMDDLRVYNRALAEEEVTRIFQFR